MSFEFKPAIRENVSLLIALAGASGSGKTCSALRLAQGMADAGKIAVIDTEARRALHYAPKKGEAADPPRTFNFTHIDLQPPFKPERFTEAVHDAEKAGAEVIIIDSFSHEYDGVGGIVEWAAALEESGTKSPGNWKLPKVAHRKMVSAFLQSRASLIFCLRADEKIEITREGGKTQVRPLGWTPICEKRFMYEMTASFTLTPNSPGRPHFGLPHKLQEQHRPFFPEGKPIDESAGRALAEWARGGALARPATPSLAQQGHDCAERGMDVLKGFWANLTPAEKQEVGGAAQLESWKRIAEDAGK